MSLIERLIRLAELWAEANKRSLPRLATVVANDGKLFDRLAAGASCTVATYDRFIAYLATPTNWPGDMPDEAKGLLHASLTKRDVTAGGDAASMGQIVTPDRDTPETGNEPNNSAVGAGAAA